MPDQLAPDSDISELAATLARNEGDDIASVDALLERYPEDPRLHFMRGSIFAGSARPIEAHAAMTQAIELAPGFTIARYQLGFFELTSGQPEQALSTWGPLLAEAEDNYLRVFVEGMTHLIRDEFAPAMAKFEHGMALNKENAPLNNDIRLLVQEVRKLDERQHGETDVNGDVSATALLLGRFGGNRTVN